MKNFFNTFIFENGSHVTCSENTYERVRGTSLSFGIGLIRKLNTQSVSRFTSIRHLFRFSILGHSNMNVYNVYSHDTQS